MANVQHGSITTRDHVSGARKYKMSATRLIKKLEYERKGTRNETWNV